MSAETIFAAALEKAGAADKVADRFRDQPEVEDAVRRTIAGTYHGLGVFDKSGRHWRAVAELERRRSGPESAEAWESLAQAGHALFHLGQPPRGVAPGCVVSAPSGRDANSATSKLRRGGKGLFARHFLPSRATNTRDSKPSLPLVNTVFNRPTAGLPASHPRMPGSWTRVVRHHMRDPEWLRWPQNSARKSSSPWRSGWPA